MHMKTLSKAAFLSLLAGFFGLFGCEKGNLSSGPGKAPSGNVASPKEILDGYYLHNKSGTHAIVDGLDGAPRYVLQFSNGQMRVKDGETVMYEGSIRKFDNFDKSCIGGEGRVGLQILCVAVNQTSVKARGYKGDHYQINLNAGQMFFQFGNSVEGNFIGLIK